MDLITSGEEPMRILPSIVLAHLLLVLAFVSQTYAKDYLPLAPGAIYTYQANRDDLVGDYSAYTQREEVLKPRLLNGREVIPVLLNKDSFTYFLKDSAGIARYAIQFVNDPEPTILEKLIYDLKYPLDPGNSWDTKTVTFLLFEEYGVDCTATIETLDDVVKVPGGTFQNCLRIRVFGERFLGESSEPSSSGTKVSIDHYYWYAPDVGVVKRTYEQKMGNKDSQMSVKMTVELLEFIKEK